MKLRLDEEKRIQLTHARSLAIKCVTIFMAIGLFVGLLFFARPSVSENEKRELTKFPAFTISGFLDGSWFSDISLYYSDTYPFRDALISLDQSLKSLFGIESDTNQIGGQQSADEIPVDDTVEPETIAPITPISEPDAKEMEAEIKNKLQSGLYVENGAAYSTYYYNHNAAVIYTDAVNDIATALNGRTTIYSVLVPDQSSILLSQEMLDKLACTDADQAIAYYISRMNSLVKGVNCYQNLRDHNSEYVYFRTDHHWTALGAYYAYQDFCELKGVTANDINSYETKTFDNFLGSYYSTLQNSEMKANPDYVKAYIPHGTNDMKYTDTTGTTYDWNVIRDVSTWGTGTKYNTFVAGDQPMAVIENPQIHDGSSCVILKDSYGNAFVPFLVDHYQTVYVIDFRYTTVNVKTFVEQNDIDDLILVNNLTLVGSDSVATTLAGLLKN